MHALCGRWWGSNEGNEFFAYRNYPCIRPFQLNPTAHDWCSLSLWSLPIILNEAVLTATVKAIFFWLQNWSKVSHRQYNSAGKQQLLLILVVCRLLGASANSVYQTLFSPPPHNSLETRLAYPATLKVRGIAHVLNFPRTRNYPVTSIQLWHHNVYLPLYHLCIFWPTMTFLWLCILLHPPTARYFWYESQDSCTGSRHFWCFLGKKKSLYSYCLISLWCYHLSWTVS